MTFVCMSVFGMSVDGGVNECLDCPFWCASLAFARSPAFKKS